MLMQRRKPCFPCSAPCVNTTGLNNGNARWYTPVLAMRNRDAGLSLADIASALDADPADRGHGTGETTPLNAILEERLEELHREMVALRNQRTIITGLLGLDSLPEATPITRELWTSLLTDAGFSEDDMRRWHADFERTAPEQHARFMKVLGIPPSEIGLIRAWAAAPQR